MDLQGQVMAGAHAVAEAIVLVSDEGIVVGGASSDEQGNFVVSGLPEAGWLTVRAVHRDHGAARQVVTLGAEVELSLSVAGCFGYVDLPEPRLLVDDAFLATWGVTPLEPACEGCVTYRWFWERHGLTPVVLRLDFVGEAVHATVRYPGDPGGSWVEHTRALKPKHARRVDQAIGHSGYWQLEHLDTSGACATHGSESAEWTIEAIASPGYRAVYRFSPFGTPITLLGRQWQRASGLKVRKKDFR